MKVVQQLLTDDLHNSNDALNKDGSSVLGKYIIGAKNNFRGFNSRQEDKSTSLKVTVHHGEEGVGKEKIESDTMQETVVKQELVGECETEGSKVTECDVVKMEEGRAKAQLGVNKETENKEQAEAHTSENTGQVKEEGAAGERYSNLDEMVNAEATQDEAPQKSERQMLTRAKDGEKHTEVSPKQAEGINENTDIKCAINKFKDIELKEKKAEAKWRKGRKFENNVAEKSDVKEINEKPATKKIVPSPTGSSSSQDTGFGSQEGEGSIDGTLLSP